MAAVLLVDYYMFVTALRQTSKTLALSVPVRENPNPNKYKKSDKGEGSVRIPGCCGFQVLVLTAACSQRFVHARNLGAVGAHVDEGALASGGT